MPALTNDRNEPPIEDNCEIPAADDLSINDGRKAHSLREFELPASGSFPDRTPIEA